MMMTICIFPRLHCNWWWTLHKSYITSSHHDVLWNKFPKALCKIHFETDCPHATSWKPSKIRLLIHTVPVLQPCTFSLTNKLTFLWVTPGYYNIPIWRWLIQTLFPLRIITSQSQTSHRQMKIISDDLHKKFRNNPHEKKNVSSFLLKGNSSQRAQSVAQYERCCRIFTQLGQCQRSTSSSLQYVWRTLHRQPIACTKNIKWDTQ